MGKGHYLGGHTIIRLGPRPSGGKHLSHFVKKEGYLTTLVKEANLSDYKRPETHPDVCAAQANSRPSGRRHFRRNQKKKAFSLPPEFNKHFDFSAQNKRNFLEELEPILNAYAKQQFRSHAELAHRLNKAGYRTACGTKWSAKLVALLWDVRKHHIRDRANRYRQSNQRPSHPLRGVKK